MKDIVAGNGGVFTKWVTDAAERQRLWRARHNAWCDASATRRLAVQCGGRYAALSLRPGTRGFATDVCVPISRLAPMVAHAKAAIASLRLTGPSARARHALTAAAPIVGHVGDGNFHCLVVIHEDDPAELAAARELGHQLAACVVAAHARV